MTTLFRNSSPGALTLKQSVELQRKRLIERGRQMRQARELAAKGRGGDTEIAHVTIGEIVLPKVLQTRGVLDSIRQAAVEANIPLDCLRIGSPANSINPETGMPEFGLDDGPGLTPEMEAQASHAANIPIDVSAPWRDIDKDKLTGILYNEMSGWRGDPQELDRATWAMAQVIKNRQAAGINETLGGPKQTLPTPVIRDREWQAINNSNVPLDNNPAKQAYNRASGIADLITSAPQAFPSPEDYRFYNHRPDNGQYPNLNIGPDARPVLQFGPFDGLSKNRYLDIYK